MILPMCFFNLAGIDALGVAGLAELIFLQMDYSCSITENSNTTSFPERWQYTKENKSSLYSNDVASFESRNLKCTNSHLGYWLTELWAIYGNIGLLPTIFVGYTRSSRIFSWTLVRVWLQGRFCLTCYEEIFDTAMKKTWQSENLFLSSWVNQNDNIRANSTSK